MKADQIVILGHLGFIGSHLEAFIQKNGFKVIGKSLPEIDLSNKNEIEKIAEYFTPETTLILVAAIKRQFGDTLESFQMNMAITENICHLLMKKPVRQVIFFSSAAVYGEETHNLNINEETQINATSYYGIAKYTSERLLYKAVSFGFPNSSLICLRPPLIYGPGDKGRTYGPSGFCADAAEGLDITLWGDGTELREFMFIDDICSIVLHLIGSSFNGVLNTVSGSKYSFAQVLHNLNENYPSLVIKTRERSKQKADNAFDASLIKSIVGNDFKFTSLAQGIGLTLTYNK
jgi:nucleoside-diphosphate-sugar epimerase